MKYARLMGGVVVGMLALAPIGCGGKAGDAAAGATDATGPAALGEAAGKVYKDLLTALTKALESKPEPADATAKANAIIEPAKLALLELGKKREVMAAADKKAYDNKLTKASFGYDDKPMRELVAHYRKADRVLADLLEDTLAYGRYANFDSLKMMSPKEAEKYGIK